MGADGLTKFRLRADFLKYISLPEWMKPKLNATIGN